MDALPRPVERALLLELLKEHAEPMTGKLKHDYHCPVCILIGAHRIDVNAARESLAFER